MFVTEIVGVELVPEQDPADVAVVNVHPVLEAADVEGVHALRGQRVGLEEGGAARRTLSCCAGVCRCGHGRRGYRRQG